MKDKTARIIAIIALIFMVVFIASMTVTFSVASKTVSTAFMYTTIASGAVALGLFFLLKATGRGFSVADINNEIEMEKIRKENEALQQQANAEAEPDVAETPDSTDEGAAE